MFEVLLGTNGGKGFPLGLVFPQVVDSVCPELGPCLSTVVTHSVELTVPITRHLYMQSMVGCMCGASPLEVAHKRWRRGQQSKPQATEAERRGEQGHKRDRTEGARQGGGNREGKADPKGSQEEGEERERGQQPGPGRERQTRRSTTGWAFLLVAPLLIMHEVHHHEACISVSPSALCCLVGLLAWLSSCACLF